MERSIEASTTVRAAPARVGQVLVEDPGAVVGRPGAGRDRGRRRFLTDLTADMGAGASLRQEVAVDVGPVTVSPGDGSVTLAISWKATGRDRLFPAFHGLLEVRPDRVGTRVRLAGVYTVPLGALGRFGDGVVGRRVARRSLACFVDDLARRLDAEVEKRAAAPVRRTRAVLASEVYIG